MRVYADSSFLVSCYLADANTSKAKAFLLDYEKPLPFTALHDLEVRNALRLGVFRSLITDEEAGAAVATIDLDLRSGRLARVLMARDRGPGPPWCLTQRSAAFLIDVIAPMVEASA